MHKIKGFNLSTKSALKNAYAAAQGYFIENSEEPTITSVAILKNYGYTETPGVTITIIDGTMSDLDLRGKHINGDKTYKVSNNGLIYSP